MRFVTHVEANIWHNMAKGRMVQIEIYHRFLHNMWSDILTQEDCD